MLTRVCRLLGSGIVSVADDYQDSLHAHNSYNQKATAFSPPVDFSTANTALAVLSQMSQELGIALGSHYRRDTNSRHLGS